VGGSFKSTLFINNGGINRTDLNYPPTPVGGIPKPRRGRVVERT